MLFNSIDFLIFFPVVVLIYFIIPDRIKYIWLLAASYYFYMGWNAKYALLLLFSTAVTYLSGIAMDAVGRKTESSEKRIKYRKLVVALSFILNLGILFVFCNKLLDLRNAHALQVVLLHKVCAIDRTYLRQKLQLGDAKLRI